MTRVAHRTPVKKLVTLSPNGESLCLKIDHHPHGLSHRNGHTAAVFSAVRTGAPITVVANATRNVDADAGSIRYVATVIDAPV